MMLKKTYIIVNQRVKKVSNFTKSSNENLPYRNKESYPFWSRN